MARAETQHVAVLAGNFVPADDFDARCLSLPENNAYIESRRAKVLRLTARAKVTEEAPYLEAL